MSGQMSLFDYEPEDNLHTDFRQEIKPISLNKDIAGARLIELVPEKATLALTRGYVIRAIHVSRILNLLEEKKNEKEIITREEIGQQLSMTWASAQSHMNVMRRLEVLDAKTKIAPLGSTILRNSPHIDDIGLLWLLHYIVASDSKLVLWSNLFNTVFFDVDEASVQDATETFRILDGRWSAKSLIEKVPKEIGAILRTYTEGVFLPLRLVTKVDTGVYEIAWNSGLIPVSIWLSCILVYRDRYYPGASSLEIPLLIRANFSPGRILRQQEQAVRKALDGLHTSGLLTVETRSGLDQVRFKRDYTWFSTISQYLAGDVN